MQVHILINCKRRFKLAVFFVFSLYFITIIAMDKLRYCILQPQRFYKVVINLKYFQMSCLFFQVDNSLTKSFTPSWQGPSYIDQMSSSIKQLSIEVSELHVGDDGELRLTCMATIPGYVSHNEEYGDVRKHSVKSRQFDF